MADVRAPAAGRGRRGPGRTTGRRRQGGRDERGQLILVTALSLAILFVSLALILNTAIYTENLATRSSDIGGGTDAVRYHDAARDGVGGLITYGNYHNNSSHETLATNLSTGVEAFGDESALQFAASTRAVEVDLASTTNGTRVAQTNASRNFTDVSGTADWVVVSGATRTRDVRLHVYRDELVSLFADGFRLAVTDGGDEWNLTVHRPALGADIRVEVRGPTGSGSCTVAASDAWINVSEETVGGEDCPILGTFADGVPMPYNIVFWNGDDIRGTYTLVVDEPSLADAPGPALASDGSGQPFATHAVYSATVEVTYQTPRLYYRTTVRVAPGEPS